MKKVEKQEEKNYVQNLCNSKPKGRRRQNYADAQSRSFAREDGQARLPRRLRPAGEHDDGSRLPAAGRTPSHHARQALEISGALVTMYDSRIVFHREVVSVIEETYEGHLRVFKSKIPASIKATESQSRAMSIFEHDPTGKVASGYERFTRELLGEV